MADELKRIFPAKTYTLATGEEISVSPVKFKNLVRFGEALASVISKIAEAGISLGDTTTPEDIMAILKAAYPEVVKIMVLALDQTEEWIGELESTDAVGLLALVFEQNLSSDAKKKIAEVFASLTGA